MFFLLPGKSATQQTNSIIKMLASIVAVFFLSWLSFHVQRLLSIFMFEKKDDNDGILHTIFILVFYTSGCCYYSNSACNPILYSIFSKNYRRAFPQIFIGKKQSAQFLSYMDATSKRKHNLFQKPIISREISNRKLFDSSFCRTFL
ncbi:7 transmembrane receptor (rhodopsin family) protein [Acanthocheilonema viteae]